MRQIGLVISISGDTAVVRFQRSAACGKCKACFQLGSDEADMEIENTIGTKAGDRVVVEMHGNTMLKASLIMYGIPVLALVAGVAAGSAMGDSYAFLGGILFAAGAFFIIRAFEPKFSRMNEFKPRMLGLADTDEGGEEDGGDSCNR